MDNTNFADLIKEYTELTIELANEISSTEREKILLKTAKNLPDNPADSGMKALAVKPYFYAFATDTDNSLLSFMNRAIRTTNEVLNSIKDKTNAEFDSNNSRVNDLVNRLVSFNTTVINRFNSIQSQVNTIAGNVDGNGSTIGDLETRVQKVEKLLTSDNIDLDTLQEIVDVLENSAEDIENIFIQLASKVDKVEGKSLIDDELIEFVEEEANYNLLEGVPLLMGTTNENGLPVAIDDPIRVVTESYVQIKPNTTYGIDAKNLLIYEINLFDSNKTHIYMNIFNKQSYTFTTPDNCYYMTILFRRDMNNNVITVDDVKSSVIMVDKSQHRRLFSNDVDFLKEESLKSANLLDLEKINFLGDTYVVNEQTKKDLTLYSYGNNWTNANFIISLEPYTTYTISATIENPNSLNCGFRVTDINTNQIAVWCKTDNNFYMQLNFTTNENTQYEIQFYLNWAMSGQGTVYYKSIMLNKGSTALPYQEYRGNVLRRKDLFNVNSEALSINEGGSLITLSDGLYIFATNSSVLGASYTATIFMVIENQKGMSTVYTTMGGTNAEIRCLVYSSGHLKVARAYGNDTWEVADSPSGTFTYKKIG